MSNHPIFLSRNLTQVLGEINEKKSGSAKKTITHSELSEDSRQIIKNSFHAIKQMMSQLATHLDISAHGLKLSMGKYQTSGNWFPHIWGAYIPIEAKKSSKVTTQLFFFREVENIAWGIAPSSIATTHKPFMEAFRNSLVNNKDKVYDLFSKGFRGRISGVVGQNQMEIADPEEFLKSESLTLLRLSSVSLPHLGDNFNNLVKSDFELLFPLYAACVTEMRRNNFWTDLKRVQQKDSKQYWLIAAGPRGEQWNMFQKDNLVAISFKELNGKSLLSFSSRDEIEKTLMAASNSEKRQKHNSLACFEFANKIKKGDQIFVKSGVSKLVGLGEIVSDYEFDNSRQDYQHLRKVRWLNRGSWNLPKGENFVKKTLTNIAKYEGYVDHLTAIVNEPNNTPPLLSVSTGKITPIKPSAPPLSLEQLCELTGKSGDFFKMMARRLEEKKQIILCGPPGTGKTFIVEAFCRWFQNGTGNRETIQFHPSYSYEDFIEGYRPNSHGGFTPKSGLFAEFCSKATNSQTSPPARHVFIIDEINRGNLANVFGELLHSLEYRGHQITLPYSNSPFEIPDNVYLIGTMNTSDRSIAILDYAIRRRFDFIEIAPDLNVLKSFLESNNCTFNISELLTLVSNLNAIIKIKLGEDYELGQSFWMKANMDKQKLQDVIKYNIRPLLKEYFFNDHDTLKEIEEKVLVDFTDNPKAA